MSLTNMRVSYVGNQITVRIPVSDVPQIGYPFTIAPFTLPQFPVTQGITSSDLTEVGYRTYTIPVDSTQSYMVKTVTLSGSGGFTTPEIIQGESYGLQPAPITGVLVFKNLDAVAPTLMPFSQQIPIATVSAFDSTSGLPPIAAPGNPPANTAYYVAKFSEAVTGVTNNSFIITQNNAPSQAQTVQPLWLTSSSTWSNAAPSGSVTAASYYLVTVNAPLDIANNRIYTRCVS